MADNEKAMDKYGHAWRVGDMSLCLTALVSLMSGMGGWDLGISVHKLLGVKGCLQLIWCLEQFVFGYFWGFHKK